ncbi:hypothetical protein ACP4OV_009111 [Aristida adscensionis]
MKTAAASSDEAMVAAADSAAATAGGVPKEEKGAAVAAAAAAAAEDTGRDEHTPGCLTRLPEEYVSWILRQERVEPEEDPDEYYNRMISDADRPAIYTQEFLEEERQLLRDMNELYKCVGDRFEKFQSWVRGELEAKGFVEVDDDYLAQRVRLRQLVTKEQWLNRV